MDSYLYNLLYYDVQSKRSITSENLSETLYIKIVTTNVFVSPSIRYGIKVFKISVGNKNILGFYYSDDLRKFYS